MPSVFGDGETPAMIPLVSPVRASMCVHVECDTVGEFVSLIARVLADDQPRGRGWRACFVCQA